MQRIGRHFTLAKFHIKIENKGLYFYTPDNAPLRSTLVTAFVIIQTRYYTLHISCVYPAQEPLLYTNRQMQLSFMRAELTTLRQFSWCGTKSPLAWH